MKKALTLHVYRSARLGDCTNGGITAKHDTLYVLCDKGNVPIDEANPPENLVQLVKRQFRGRDIFHLEPVTHPAGAGWMAGGNYAGSSDSRFGDMTGMYGAVSVHDRQESWETHDRLSR